MARAALLERLRSRGPSAWRTATVREVIEENPRARTLVLDVPGWPGHRAGQHLDVRLTAEDGYQASRSYSIASAPELDDLEITVVEVDDGEVSPYFVQETRPGDQFEVRGPIGGHFTWSADERGPLLLIAGGSGLVPLMAMLRHRGARGSMVEAHLLVSARTPDDLLYRAELAALQQAAGLSIDVTNRAEPVALQPAPGLSVDLTHPAEPAALPEAAGLSVDLTYTRSAPDGWTGFTGRVDAAMVARVGPPAEAMPRCFVCGPTPFVEAVTTLLVDAGYRTPDIHAERFGPTGG